MRLTVTRRIVVSLALVIAVAVAALLIIHDGLARVVAAVHELAEIREPTYSATLEVELNVNGSVMAAFAYLDDPDPRYREIARKDERDIAVFHARFVELAETDADRQLGARLGELNVGLHAAVAALMDTRDRQAAAWREVSRYFERADSIIDVHLEARVDARAPLAAEKLNALGGVESDLAEVGVSLGNVRRDRDPDHRTLIAANANEFRAAMRRLRSLPLLAREARQVAALDRTFERMMQATWRLLELDDAIRGQSTRLIDLRSEMDHLLDEQIQAAAQHRLYQPRQDAERVASSALRQIQWLGILVLLVAVTTGALLTRSISRPVRALKTGAMSVGRGDLTHRIALEPGNRDEFAELAAAFNDMVEQLQSTTVSKELLEGSEHKLLETVEQLRREITERLRAEEERVRLEASLRRSETMSAMGTLVAGVAHEVRNPLFGILSVLEAMDARFGGREEYQRYLEVLREQADRLNRLMQELLEYGKPPNRELAPGSVSDVLAEALTATRAFAERAGVRLDSRVAEDGSRVMLDRNRLLRVFLNLLENAIQHTPPGETVLVESYALDEDGSRWVEYAVSDTGPGFRSEDLPHIFQPFFTRRREGTGLGLSIVQRIVEEHGGHVAARNRDGSGAVVIVRLPVCGVAHTQLTGRHVEA
jgi:signal transduction histidine kinase